MEYIVKITLVKEKIQGYLSIYRKNTNQSGAKKKKKEMYIVYIEKYKIP